jgi:hypothetical protein
MRSHTGLAAILRALADCALARARHRLGRLPGHAGFLDGTPATHHPHGEISSFQRLPSDGAPGRYPTLPRTLRACCARALPAARCNRLGDHSSAAPHAHVRFLARSPARTRLLHRFNPMYGHGTGDGENDRAGRVCHLLRTNERTALCLRDQSGQTHTAHPPLPPLPPKPTLQPSQLPRAAEPCARPPQHTTAAAHHTRPSAIPSACSSAGPRARVEHQAGRRACTPHTHTHAQLGSCAVLLVPRVSRVCVIDLVCELCDHLFYNRSIHQYLLKSRNSAHFYY